MKQEVFKFYKEERIQFGLWTMAYDNTGPRLKPVDFKELNFMLELPKSLYNQKINMIVL